MAPRRVELSNKEKKASVKKKSECANKGAWTAEEDQKLAEAIEIHGAKKWKIIATKAGLKRCAKSCRLRWLNYLRPNIKRGNISDQEEDLILRLHKLLGNRWSLIAGRLPGRTDNEIKNYWNTHLSKRMNPKKKKSIEVSGKGISKSPERREEEEAKQERIEENKHKIGLEESQISSFDVEDFFDFSNEDPVTLEWISKFLEFSQG